MSVDIPKLQKRADKRMKTVFCFRKSYFVCKKNLKSRITISSGMLKQKGFLKMPGTFVHFHAERVILGT